MSSGTSAGFGRRFAALIYDAVLLAALLTLYTLIVVLVHGGAVTREGGGPRWWAFRAGELLLIGGYYVLNWTRSGATLGMRAWHLRAVTDSGKPLKLARAVSRFLWGLAAWAPAALGVLWLYLDPERLALHDRLSRTRMVHLSRQ
ncbi:MAG TPA: RDD family protein [Steroidobacteraceae bacterium]|nr:RDD family protein [Steroidobacteraceae bacterium]